MVLQPRRVQICATRSFSHQSRYGGQNNIAATMQARVAHLRAWLFTLNQHGGAPDQGRLPRTSNVHRRLVRPHVTPGRPRGRNRITVAQVVPRSTHVPRLSTLVDSYCTAVAHRARTRLRRPRRGMSGGAVTNASNYAPTVLNLSGCVRRLRAHDVATIIIMMGRAGGNGNGRGRNNRTTRSRRSKVLCVACCGATTSRLPAL